MSSAPLYPEENAIARPVRWAALPIGFLAALYMLCATIYNAPASPLQVRLLPSIDHIILPYFAQTWTLFAPTPPTFNENLDVQAVVRLGDGRLAYTQFEDVVLASDQLAENNHLLPSKLPKLPLAFEESFAGYSNVLRSIRKEDLSRRERDVAEYRLNKAFAVNFAEFARYLSAEAAVSFRGARIVRVRGLLAQMPVTPFSDRYEARPSRQSPEITLISQWMPYVNGVGS